MTARWDAGSSLVEVLLSVAIMGIASTAILGALGTQIAGTGVHRDRVNAAAVASSAAERVKAVEYEASCTADTLTDYQDAARQATLPSDWATDKSWTTTQAIDVIEIAFWDGDSFEHACMDAVAGDSAGLLRLQQVTVEVTGPEGDKAAVTVLKSALR